jgi:hypothetical protein
MGLYYDAPPEQPSYGEALTESTQAQIDLLPQIIASLPMESELRKGLQDMELDLLQRGLIGDVTRAGEGGRYVSGQQFRDASGAIIEDAQQIKSEEDRAALWLSQRPDLQQVWDKGGQSDTGRRVIAQIKNEGGGVEDFAKWHRDLAQTGHFGQEEQRRANLVPEVGEFYDPQGFDLSGGESGVLTQEDIYSIHKGGEGAVVDRSGGMLDLYGGQTKVRQFNQAKYDELKQQGMSDAEARDAATTYGTAGFDEATGEFMGILPMIQQAEAYLASQQREADIADMEILGGRGTDAIRDQGLVRETLAKLHTLFDEGRASTADYRSKMLTEGMGLIGTGLSEREEGDLRRSARQAAAAGGGLRDFGRVVTEATDITEGNRQRRVENLGMAQNLLGAEVAYQQGDYGKALQLLGAEMATSADPLLVVTGRPSQSGPSAESLLSQGGALQSTSPLVNPESGLSYMSQKAANEATVAAGQAAATGNIISGLTSGFGNFMGGQEWGWWKKNN